MAGQEPAQADLEALAEEFGFITTNQIKELYALSSRITDLSELEIQLKTTPKNELTEQQKKYLLYWKK